MPSSLDILIVEDSVDDAELLVMALRSAGFEPRWKRVETEPEFWTELKKLPNIIFSDYSMPQFSGLRAAELLQQSGLDIPFILISGTVGEDVAVEAMKRGATDYFLKDRIARLGNAVERALEQKRLRDERKRTQEELIWKTAFLEAQVDSSLDAILVVNDSAKRILQNQRLFQLFKVPDHIARDDDDANLLRHVTSQIKNPKQFSERVAYLYAHPDEIGHDEIELADGKILDRYSAPVRDKTGKYYGRIWTFRDITERRKLEEQFRQSQKMEAIGQLAGGVAHDFNNLLTVIQGNASLLLSDETTKREVQDFTQQIILASKRAADLTRQLLLFSRKQVMQPADLDLNDVVTGIAKMQQRLLGENIEMQFKSTPEPLFIHADSGMVQQILMNLAVNSRDAMPDGGRLIIETSAIWFDELTISQTANARPGPFACLSVTDVGSGIPPEVLPRIFEPFFTTKDVGKGTGLGLATVFGIIQQHHGWINVFSQVGCGTTFRIYLPRLATGRGSAPAQSALRSVSGGNETILLVEDESTVRVLMESILKRLGYRVIATSTSVDALEVWDQNRNDIQLLLTDLIMPDGMNGRDLAQRFLRDNARLKVIYTSGYSTEIAGPDFLAREGVNFLPKPFESNKLAQIVRDCLDQKHPGASQKS